MVMVMVEVLSQDRMLDVARVYQRSKNEEKKGASLDVKLSTGFRPPTATNLS